MATWYHGYPSYYGSRETTLSVSFIFSKRTLFLLPLWWRLLRLRPSEEGVPQDGVLSVTLFAVGINGITLVLLHGVLLTLYVDDFSVSFGRASVAADERRLKW